MTDAQTILKMIETVDPNDTDKLDEIDGRVECFVQEKQYVSHYSDVWGFTAVVRYSNWDYADEKIYPRLFTRSRDALKAIRPEWAFMHKEFNGGLNDQVCISDAQIDGNYFTSPYMRTEELAELHAIIQAIEYERGNK